MKDPLWRNGRWLIRSALRGLVATDDWSEEFVRELDRELQGAARRRSGVRLSLWYLRQVASPQTARFLWLMRRRRRAAAGHGRHRNLTLIFDGAGQDLRQAWRRALGDSWAAVLIVTTLGLGIGSVTAMYGVADQLFLSGPRGVLAPAEHSSTRPRRGRGTGS